MPRIYPELDMSLESFDRTPPARSNLERNCGQIFTKGPAITKDLLEKVQKAELGNNTTCIMGYEVETRQFWVICGLLLLFVLSSVGVIIMWFTDMFDNAIFANLAIVEGSASYEIWRKPSPKPLLKIHIFNYTNVAEFEAGNAKKLNVKELGPYVYEVSLERINVNFNGTTVSYQEGHAYKFMPELSQGRKQNDKVTVPNVPMLAAAAVNKHATFLDRLSVSGLLKTLSATPFLTLPAHRFIVGYEDNLYSITKSVLKFQNQKPYDNLGLIASTVGVRDDIVTINTGIKDINKIGVIEKFNGKSLLRHWSTDECNSLEGATDGSMFSPKQVRNKRPVTFYVKEMCRTLPLHYEKDVKILNGKIPAYRYTLPYDVFDSPDRVPSNQCFCNLDLGECPPQGVFNATPCAFGAPAFISFPHFYNGDPALLEGVTGLNPKPTLHKTYADLHPTLGFVMSGKTRIQFNIQVKKSFGLFQLDSFEDNMMLPVSWFELSLEDKTLPEDMVGLIFQTTFTLKSIELGLKYGCLLTAIVTLLGALLVFKNKWHKKNSIGGSPPSDRFYL